MKEAGKPYFCPFCGGSRLLADDPMEAQAEGEIWIIYHWICEECGEYFNRIHVVPEEDETQKNYWD